MNTSEITTPQQLGKVLKQHFSKIGIEIRTRYIKTVRGLEGSWFEITSFKSGDIIPNELRKQFVCLQYEKDLKDLNILNVNDICYGNVQPNRVALHGRDWKKWLESL